MQGVVGRYRLLERVGHGAMGEVYRGRGPVGDADVAVKILSADFEGDDDVRARFAQEATAAARLQHRNIVRIIEASLDDDPPFIVMEFLRGRSLAARLKSGPRPGLATALDIAVQLCEGLHYAHEHGVIHRDVNPANIWLEEDGTLKLLDFGVAHIGDTGLTRHGEAVGTLAYTAPEQITGGRVDRRADLFSVGAVLFELLSGRRPFDGSTPAAMLKRVRGGVSLPVGSLPADVPADVRAAILKTTDSSVDQRYDTAADLAVDLRLALLSLPASALGAPLVDPDAPVDMLAPTVAFALTEVTQTVAPVEMRPPTPIVAPADTRPPTRTLDASARAVEMDAGVDAPTELVPSRPAPPQSDLLLHGLGTDPPPPSLPSSPPSRSSPGTPPARPQAPAWSARVAAGVAPPREALALAVSKARLTARNVARTVRGRAAIVATSGLVIVIAAWIGFAGRGRERPTTQKAAPPPSVGATGPSAASRADPPAESTEVLIDSRPAGARIWFGNRDSGLRTPARVARDTARDVRITLRLPGYEDVSVPAGASGLATRTVTLSRERERRSLKLVATGSYPFDVVVGGRVVSARRTEHAVTFAEGQPVRLRAAEYFLDMPVVVGGQATTEVRAAGLGDLEVRSARETCLVTIDGRRVDYPPVKRRVAAGAHVIALADCPGAAARVRTEVRAGVREIVSLR